MRRKERQAIQSREMLSDYESKSRRAQKETASELRLYYESGFKHAAFEIGISISTDDFLE